MIRSASTHVRMMWCAALVSMFACVFSAGPGLQAGVAAGAPGCSRTSLNIVAHEDDDLLFMNPDIQNDLAAGSCMTTVFLTAGDGGYGTAYWHERELGP